MAEQLFKEYRDVDFEKLRRRDLGPRSFDGVSEQIQDLKSIFDQMIEIIGRNPKLPTGILNSVTSRINDFMGAVVKPIQNYDYKHDEKNQFRTHDEITRKIQEIHREVFNVQQPNLLSLYSAIRTYDITGTADIMKQADDAKRKYEDLTKQQEGVLNSLRTKAGSETIQKYSEIFHEQAQKHSSFYLSWKPKFKLKIGAAYLWIATGVILIILGFSNIHKLDEWFPMESPNQYIQIGMIIKRLAMISLWVYGVTFCLRQFSINKHLFTLNKHRENALNSFILFVESIGKDDPSARSQLMLQVAKAIYEHGNTGYLHEKSGDAKEPSIVELTRFINPKQGV